MLRNPSVRASSQPAHGPESPLRLWARRASLALGIGVLAFGSGWVLGSAGKRLFRSAPPAVEHRTEPSAETTVHPASTTTTLANPVADSSPAEPSDPRTGPSLATSSSFGSVGSYRDGDYTVQVAAVPDPTEARALLEQLTRARYAAYVASVAVDHGTLYRVRIEPFPSRRAAQQVASRLETQGYEHPWVTTK